MIKCEAQVSQWNKEDRANFGVQQIRYATHLLKQITNIQLNNGIQFNNQKPTIKTFDIYFRKHNQKESPMTPVLRIRATRLNNSKTSSKDSKNLLNCVSCMSPPERATLKEEFKGETSQSYRICITVYKYIDQLLHKYSPSFDQHNLNTFRY